MVVALLQAEQAPLQRPDKSVPQTIDRLHELFGHSLAQPRQHEPLHLAGGLPDRGRPFALPLAGPGLLQSLVVKETRRRRVVRRLDDLVPHLLDRTVDQLGQLFLLGVDDSHEIGVELGFLLLGVLDALRGYLDLAGHVEGAQDELAQARRVHVVQVI